MGKRPTKPPYPVQLSSQADPVQEMRTSSFIDPSPLVLDQFCRPQDGRNRPMGDAVSIPVRRSSSYQRTHIKDDEEHY